MYDGGHSLNGTLSMPDFGTLQFWYHMGNHSYTITGQFFLQKKNIQEESIYYLWGEFGGNLNFQKYPIFGHLGPWFLIRKAICYVPNCRITEYYVIFIYFQAAVSALCWLSQFCTLKKK